MYRIPLDLDLSDIKGSEIQMISCGRYDVHFHFHSGRKIRAQGAIQVLRDKEVIGSWDDVGQWTSTAFQHLLNLAISGYEIPNDRLLKIMFDDGYILALHDDSDDYETMLIEPGCIVI